MQIQMLFLVSNIYLPHYFPPQKIKKTGTSLDLFRAHLARKHRANLVDVVDVKA